MRANTKTIRLYTEKHMENIRTMFTTLYNDEQLADVTLCCKKGSIKAHKIILAASSPYFRKVFVENPREHAVFIMHGVEYEKMRNLIELIYRGTVDVPDETLNSIYDLAEDLEVNGVLVDDGTVLANGSDSNGLICGPDTRYKGQKRVAVDYEQDGTQAKICKNFDRRLSSSSSSEKFFQKKDDPTGKPLNDAGNPAELKLSPPEKQTSSAWALKVRKFKCELCTSSFKRASHLTRHQLVHTGERPYACDQCDKAFSRHDKLKHHIRKTHEMDLMDLDLSTPIYTIGQVRISSPEPYQGDEPPPVVASDLSPPPKKGRGRPRKYPPITPPLIKRPRGRPRLNPVVLPPHMIKRENYDITNLPYGDLESLTDLTDSNEAIEDPKIMEPLIEIKTEPPEGSDSDDKQTELSNQDSKCSKTFLGNMGLFENTVGKIGECTISVANNPPGEEHT